MKISFCTQIYNRRWQLEQTLDENLALLRGTTHELLIYDLGSTDGLHEFVQARLPEHRENLRVIVEPREYDMIFAKNRAHALASGEYLFNLDADNFITPELLEHITSFPTDAVHNWSGDWADGSHGRVGMPSSVFHACGGYPSYMVGCAAHDWVMCVNLTALVKLHHLRTLSRPPIYNDKDATVSNLDTRGMTWGELHKYNIALYNERPVFMPELDVTLKAGSFGVTSGFARRVTCTTYTCSPKRVMRYELTVDPNFDFGQGGFLPGLGNGDCYTVGRESRGWTARPFWRRDGSIDLRAYYPTMPAKFGHSIPTGAKLTPGDACKLELSFDHERATLTVDGRHSASAQLYGPPTWALYHAFRGGDDLSWSSPRDCHLKIRPW